MAGKNKGNYMVFKKVIIGLICSGLLLGTQSFAKGNKEHKIKKEKVQKHRKLPRGLQKKVDRGGELPPGWQKKLVKGDVISDEVLTHSKVLHTTDYSSYPYKTQGTEVYRVENKIIKVIKATNVILDVLDL